MQEAKGKMQDATPNEHHVSRFTFHLDKIIAGLLFVLSLGLYVRTLAPSVVDIFSDTLEFQLVGPTLGIAHETGYPLYTLLSWLFARLMPLGDAAFRVNLLSAVCAALAGLPIALAVAYLLARASFPGKWVLEAVVNAPLVLPPVVTGYLLLILLAPRGPIGSVLGDVFGVKIVFTWWAAVVASAVVSFPLMVRAIRLAFEAIDPRLEMAARSLGASRLATFFSVTLPLARRGVIAGWMLAFARSLGEFGATIMVAGNIEGYTNTIPLQIYSMSSEPGGMGQCWRLVVLSIILACGALAVSELLARRQNRHESA